MNRLLNRDTLSGILFVAIGLAGLIIGADYAMGTAFRMGPGYFPRVLCGVLVALGAIVAIRGIIMGGELPDRLHFKPLILVTIATAAFALLITHAGLLPASVAIVLLGAMGGPEFRIIEAVVLAAVLSAAAIGLFIYGLGMPLAIVSLPSF